MVRFSKRSKQPFKEPSLKCQFCEETCQFVNLFIFSKSGKRWLFYFDFKKKKTLVNGIYPSSPPPTHPPKIQILEICFFKWKWSA
jgi:hypothetical protein